MIQLHAKCKIRLQMTPVTLKMHHRPLYQITSSVNYITMVPSRASRCNLILHHAQEKWKAGRHTDRDLQENVTLDRTNHHGCM